VEWSGVEAWRGVPQVHHLPVLDLLSAVLSPHRKQGEGAWEEGTFSGETKGKSISRSRL